jgi:hypothetical protein
MEPINSTALSSPEAVSTSTKHRSKGSLIRQHVDFQDAFPISCTPIQSSARLQPRLANDLGRNSYLILSGYSRNHG